MIFVHWDHKSQLWCVLSEDIPIFDYCNSNSKPIDGVKVFSSCDGLFLIGIWTDRGIEQPAGLVIWNPSTRQSIRLPHSKFSLQIGYDNDDDVDRGSTYGMAYDSTSDDYKIFRIDISGENDNEILALKNGSWRIIDGKTSGGRTDSRLLRGREFLAFVDGAFHWIGFLSKVCVISFNISDEMYGEISLPEIISSQLTLSQFKKAELEVDIHVGVSELRGMLGVYYKDDNNYNLWAMKKYGIKDSWMKLFTIVIAGGSYYNIKPKYTFSDDRVLLCFDKMIWSTPNSTRTEYIYRVISSDPMFPQQDYDKGDVVDEEGDVYTETLIFPKLGH
ncbi:F-box protein CPR30-like [Solanum tuberosum]|uniref:F-box family protein n=1 Tax=Solanum tuberosum TaxID=4113 RepID=M1DRL9_SOLTU|nr:PREDICTED: F-box protein CPR30-like [Solanum tuberosum]